MDGDVSSRPFFDILDSSRLPEIFLPIDLSSEERITPLLVEAWINWLLYRKYLHANHFVRNPF